MEMVPQVIKVYQNTTRNNRKTKWNFLREVVKNILSNSPLFDEVQNK